MGMDFREELARRLRRTSFSMAKIAKSADVSREWVSKAKSGRAHTVSEETADAIHRALNDLIERECRWNAEPLDHPVLKVLEADAQLRESLGLSAEDIEDLRGATWIGRPLTTIAEVRKLLPGIRAAQRLLGQ